MSKKANFCNRNYITNKSYCVFCLKGLPPIKRDKDYKNWNRQFHKGSCEENRNFQQEYYRKEYYERLEKNKLLITRAINNNKTPIQQLKIDKKEKEKIASTSKEEIASTSK